MINLEKENKLTFTPESNQEKENIHKAIIAEFQSIYTSLESRIDVFQKSQSNFLDKLRPKLKSVLPKLSEKELELVLTYYGISLTDEVLKNYESISFAQDINYFLTLIPDGEQVEISVSSPRNVSYTTSSTEVSEPEVSRIPNSIDENFSDGERGFQSGNEKNEINNKTEQLDFEENLKKQSQPTQQLDLEDDSEESLENNTERQPTEQGENDLEESLENNLEKQSVEQGEDDLEESLENNLEKQSAKQGENDLEESLENNTGRQPTEQGEDDLEESLENNLEKQSVEQGEDDLEESLENNLEKQSTEQGENDLEESLENNTGRQPTEQGEDDLEESLENNLEKQSTEQGENDLEESLENNLEKQSTEQGENDLEESLENNVEKQSAKQGESDLEESLENNVEKQSTEQGEDDLEESLENNVEKQSTEQGEDDLEESLENNLEKQSTEQGENDLEESLENNVEKQSTEQVEDDLEESLENNVENNSQKQQRPEDRYTHLLNLCTSYYQSNTIIEKMINQLNNDIIQLNINKLHPIALNSVLIRKHLLSAFDRSSKIFSNNSFQIDLRFIAAQIITAIEMTLSKTNRLKSRFNLFQKIKEQYPLGHGDVLHWDISETLIFASYYNKLKKKLQKQINDGIIAKKLALEAIKAQLEHKPPEQNSDESLQQKIDSLIFETLQFNRPFTHRKKQEFSRVVESLLKRRALNEYGKQDILDKRKYTEYFMNDFFPIMKEYPQFFLPLIDIRYYRNFIDDPVSHLKQNNLYIMKQFWYQMARNGYKGKKFSNPYDIGVAFGNFMYFLLNNKKILDLDF